MSVVLTKWWLFYKNSMRKVIFFIALVFSIVPLFAENASNVRVEQKGYRGDTVVITYDLSVKATIKLLMSTDMSNDFKELTKVVGDVGKELVAGSNYTIIWLPLLEYERFYADDVRFKVEAVTQSPLQVSTSQLTTSASAATGRMAGHEYVDLGLSVKWATCNIGASRPEDYGDYFAWGETRTKSDYGGWNTYKWCNGSETTLTKYKGSNTQLDSSDDAASSTSSSSSSNTTKEPTIGTENGYQYVDLGLSVKWATCNVGALDPSDYGDYYRFGETTPKNKYSGTYDGCPSYSFSVDAASVKWGGRWRMPTASQVEELTRKCTWTLITLDGVAGYNVKGKNGNSIFIPLAGYIREANNHATGVGECGFYWTSTSKTSGSTWHRLVFFKSGGIDTSCNVWGNPQYGSYAHPIRPVCP